MQATQKDKTYSVEDYFLFEESSAVRHEFINGYIYEMSGASDNHNFICQNLLLIFRALLKKKGFYIFMENMKLKIPIDKIFYYPDIIVTSEERNIENRYAQFHPVLLAEITSDSTRKTDMVDKLIQYQKFPSLKYYLIVEQDKQEIIVISRNAEGNWQSETYNQPEEIINSTALEIEISLKEIYAY